MDDNKSGDLGEGLEYFLNNTRPIIIDGVPDEVNNIINLLLKSDPEDRASSEQIYRLTKPWDLMNLDE